MRKGFNLLEVIVAMGLGFMALTLMVQLLVPSAKISARGAARTEVQESCVLALQQLVTDLQHSNPSAVGYVNSTSATTSTIVALQPLDRQSADAEPRYLAEVIQYQWAPAEGRLRRRRWETLPAALGVTLDLKNPTRLTGAQLLALASEPDPPEQRTLAGNVVEFSLNGAVPPPNLSNPLTLHLALDKKFDAAAADRFVLDQVVTLRNSQ